MKSMKKSLIILSLFSFILMSCESNVKGEGDTAVAQDFRVESFSEIDVEGKFKLYLVPNDSLFVSVQTHQNLIDNLEIKTDGETLNISEKIKVSEFEKYEIYVYYNQRISSYKLAGKVLMENEDYIDLDQVEFELNDDAKIRDFKVKAKDTEISAEDKTEINLIGATTTLSIESKDYAELDLQDYPCKVLEVEMKGESEAEVDVSKEMEGAVKENATLIYEGTPAKDVEVKDRGEIKN